MKSIEYLLKSILCIITVFIVIFENMKQSVNFKVLVNTTYVKLIVILIFTFHSLILILFLRNLLAKYFV